MEGTASSQRKMNKQQLQAFIEEKRDLYRKNIKANNIQTCRKHSEKSKTKKQYLLPDRKEQTMKKSLQNGFSTSRTSWVLQNQIRPALKMIHRSKRSQTYSQIPFSFSVFTC